MNKVLYLCTLLLLVGCMPAPNIESEYFRQEYDAATEVLESEGGKSTTSLGGIKFYIADSLTEVRDYCSNPECTGHHSSGTIILPPLPKDKCGYISHPNGSQQSYALIVIHEILHAHGLEHSKFMDDVMFKGWELFYTNTCL